MGFEAEVPIYNLRFHGSKWEGLEVKMESASVGFLFDAARMAEEIRDTKGTGQMARVEQLIKQVSACLVSWNITKRGEPIPADIEGLRAQPIDLVLELIQAWTKAVTVVPDPLVTPSANGSSLAALPTETLILAPSN